MAITLTEHRASGDWLIYEVEAEDGDAVIFGPSQAPVEQSGITWTAHPAAGGSITASASMALNPDDDSFIAHQAGSITAPATGGDVETTNFGWVRLAVAGASAVVRIRTTARQPIQFRNIEA